jgi:multicomponent Na+:H+ antiporter subunit E
MRQRRGSYDPDGHGAASPMTARPEPSETAARPGAPAPPSRPAGARLATPRRAFVLHWVVLFSFWVLLSGMLDAFHLGAGLACAGLAAALTYPMQLVKRRTGTRRRVHLMAVPWHRLARYFLWLLKEVTVANWQVLRVVLDPKLPIDPAIIRFRTGLENVLDRTILANSITLTPGTITVQVADDLFLVHALQQGEPTLAGIRSMQREIARALPELERTERNA